MKNLIHATAIVDSRAELGNNIEIGAYCIVGPNVKLGDNCKLKSHVVIEGDTTIGKGNLFFQFCSIGADPQDLTYKNENTQVIIGDNNTFRECVTVNKGTLKDDQITKVGSNNLIMAYVHLGHDVKLGNNCVIANSCNFAGHVKVEDRVIIGGGTQIAQFMRLGRGAYIGGGSVIVHDVPPFCTGYGNRLQLKGINIVGLRRVGEKKSSISSLLKFFKMIEQSEKSPVSFVKEFIKEEDSVCSELNSKLEKFDNFEELKKISIVNEFSAFIVDSQKGITPFWS